MPIYRFSMPLVAVLELQKIGDYAAGKITSALEAYGCSGRLEEVRGRGEDQESRHDMAWNYDSQFRLKDGVIKALGKNGVKVVELTE